MPKLEAGGRFKKAFAKIAARDKARFGLITKAINLFQNDVHHPSLNFEKLKGGDYCTIRVSQGERLILRQSGQDTFELIGIVDHDTMERRYG